MNLVAVLCYLTLACDNTTSQRVLTVNRNSVFATNRNTVPITTDPPPNLIPNQISVPTAKRNSARTPENRNSVQIPATRKTAGSGDGRKRETVTYPTRYDYIDVEAVLSNERIIKVLFNCVMNRGPCTREGLELKRIIPDAIQTECSKCSDRQRKQAGKVLAYLLTYKSDYWKMLVQKYDPNNIHLRKYMSDDDSDDDIASINNETSTIKK